MSTGITLTFSPWKLHGGWTAEMEFSTPEFAKAQRVSGSIRTHYPTHDLAFTLDQLVAQAERLGIQGYPDMPMHLYIDEDNESQYPQGWWTVLKAQADRLGWDFPYEPRPDSIDRPGN